MRKSKGKRLLSLLLTLCMVISLVPATAFAATTTDVSKWNDDKSVLLVKNGDAVTKSELYTRFVELIGKPQSGGSGSLRDPSWGPDFVFATEKPSLGWALATQVKSGSTDTVTLTS